MGCAWFPFTSTAQHNRNSIKLSFSKGGDRQTDDNEDKNDRLIGLIASTFPPKNDPMKHN